ncbi:MAG: hypothetical protein RSA02_03380 [Bacteroidales bacterium]
MKSKWRVCSQSNPDGIFTLRSQAEALANMLNGENMPNGEGAL